MTPPNRLRVTLLSFVVALSLQVPPFSWAQSSRTFSSLGLALEAIRQTFSVPTGFENVPGDLDKTPVTLDLSAGNVAHVFDALVAQRQAYAWNLRDGVYDIFPKKKDESFGQLTVPNYIVADATLREALGAIDQTPQVQQWLSRHHERRADLITGRGLMPPRGAPPQPDTRPRVSLSLKNALVRTILNETYGNLGGTHWVIWHQKQDISIFISP